MVDPAYGKLVANWEGPYVVTDTLGTAFNIYKTKMVGTFKTQGMCQI